MKAFLLGNWELILGAVGFLCVQLIYALSKHPSQFTGRTARLLQIAMGLISFLRSKGTPGWFKLPFSIEAAPEVKNEKPSVASGGSISSLFILFLFGVATSSCSTCMTPLQSLSYSGTVIDKAWTTYQPAFAKKCKAEALLCRKEGVVVTLDQCPKAKECLQGLGAFKDILDKGDQAIIVGVPLALKDDPSAEDWATAALKWTADIPLLLQKYGVIELPKSVGDLLKVGATLVAPLKASTQPASAPTR